MFALIPAERKHTRESWKKLCMHCPKFDETQRSGWCQKIAGMLLCWFFEGSLFGSDRGSRSTPNAAKRILCTPLQQQTTKIAHERLGPKSFHWLDLWKGFRPVVQKNLPGLIRFSSLSSSGLWSSLHGNSGHCQSQNTCSARLSSESSIAWHKSKRIQDNR